MKKERYYSGADEIICDCGHSEWRLFNIYPDEHQHPVIWGIKCRNCKKEVRLDWLYRMID